MDLHTVSVILKNIKNVSIHNYSLTVHLPQKKRQMNCKAVILIVDKKDMLDLSKKTNEPPGVGSSSAMI